MSASCCFIQNSELLRLELETTVAMAKLPQDVQLIAEKVASQIRDSALAECKKVVEAQYAASLHNLADNAQSFKAIAFGCSTVDHSWRAKLKSTCPFQDLVRAADEDRLCELDVAKLDKHIQLAQAAVKVVIESKGLVGKVEDPVEIEEGQATVMQAVLTRVECDIMQLIKEPKGNEQMCPILQKAIQTLRKEGGQEKKLLHAAMYKWCFTVLTDAKGK